MLAAPAHFVVIIRILRQAETGETIDLVYRRHIACRYLDVHQSTYRYQVNPIPSKKRQLH
jgi:hypothetical protein